MDINSKDTGSKGTHRKRIHRIPILKPQQVTPSKGPTLIPLLHRSMVQPQPVTNKDLLLMAEFQLVHTQCALLISQTVW